MIRIRPIPNKPHIVWQQGIFKTGWHFFPVNSRTTQYEGWDLLANEWCLKMNGCFR